jgi:protein-L-isoaspartate(D-aspartate) O-methyltransferase
MAQNDPRDELLDEIDEELRETSRHTGRSTLGGRVRAALRHVPRDRFVPRAEQSRAWDNVPLPIGNGQTISQPFIVAIMTELLDLQPSSKVLEVGTGSGYQTAILAALAERVCTVEVIEGLTERAQPILAGVGCTNISFKVGNGAEGWPSEAPFDAIIVTAAAAEVPPALTDQLGAPGRMVIPVGRPGTEQSLLLLSKDADGVLSRRTVLQVVFVPLVQPGH